VQKQEFLSRWIEIIKRSSAAMVYKQNFVNAVLRAVRSCSTRHTYDTAWARAVVDEVAGQNIAPDKGEIAIDLKSTARKMAGYYWDQTAYFGLRQGPNPMRQPRLLREIEALLREYCRKGSLSSPTPFREAVLSPRLNEMLDQVVDTSLEIIKGEIIPRFQRNGQEKEPFINYLMGDNVLYIPQNAALAIAENRLLLVEAVYYRWAQLLEMYNTSPRLNKKVRIIDTEDLRDRPLNRYEKYLDMENPGRLCFYCGQPVDGGPPAIDHVLPWSYLCSDDVWNLVYAHQGCRPGEYGRVLPQFFMARLEKRNSALMDQLAAYVEKDMVAGALKDAINHGIVRKYWTLCQG